MKTRAVIIAIAAAMFLISPVKSFAIPTLQLDIAGGTYDYSTETIVASGNPFTLYALLKQDAYNTLTDTYYISAAISPQVSSSANLGSFTFDDGTTATTVNVTGGMDYGTPPVEALMSYQPGDLPKHGVFPTYFKEFSFKFDSANQITAYNAADRASSGTAMDLTPNSSGGMYYAAFTIDTSLLDPAYYIHFDLYNTSVKTDGNVYVTKFAPFSHDAESYHEYEKVPEPATLLLLGGGMIGFAAIRKRIKM